MTKLIIVKRTRPATFSRLREKFAANTDVRVILDRRTEQQDIDSAVPRERRRLQKSTERDYAVVHTPGDRVGSHGGHELGTDGRTVLVHDRPWSWWER